MLRSPPLRRVCERTVRTIHCSRAEWRAAREGEERGEGREERGRQNRHSLLLLVPTAWLGQKSGAGVWIQDCSFAERLGRTDGELWREWVRDEGEEQEQEAFFSYTAPSRLSHSFSAIPIVLEDFTLPVLALLL